MTWQQRELPGSWRGLPFMARSHEGDGGRNIVVHEHPRVGGARLEDMGRVARSGTLEILILGDDYDLDLERFLVACEREGPGVLIHPWLGRILARVGKISWGEDVEAGRSAQLTLPWYEEKRLTVPRAAADTAKKVAATAPATRASVTAGFLDRFKTSGVAGVVADAAQEAVDEVRATLAPALAPVAHTIEGVEDLKLLLERATAAASSPDDLVAEITGIAEIASWETLIRWATGPLASSLQTDVVASSPTRRQIQRNAAAYLGTCRRLCYTYAAEALAERTWVVQQDAEADRDTFAALLEAEALDPEITPAEAQALDELRRTVWEDVSTRAADLVELRTVTVERPTPAVVLAQRWYGDGSRAGEIVDRNGWPRPLMVHGELQVLAS